MKTYPADRETGYRMIIGCHDIKPLEPMTLREVEAQCNLVSEVAREDVPEWKEPFMYRL